MSLKFDEPATGEWKHPERMHQNHPDAELRTAPYDSRFPHKNKSGHCFQNFVDFHRCIKAKGEDFHPCRYFQRNYFALCPNHIIERWQKAVEEDRFPASF